MKAQLAPRVERIVADLERLAELRDPALPGWTRRSFTPLYVEARVWLAEQMQVAGLTTRLDAAGNLVGRREGTEDLPPLMTGSHTDTVVGGGRFDGILGVLGAIEVARCLQESGARLRHPLDVVDFLAEEPTDFGLSTIGSRGLVGNLSASMLAQTDPTGRTLQQAIASVGGRPAELDRALLAPGSLSAFVELHIEQGPILERERLTIGVVSGIVGIHRFRVRVVGRPDHAGTTPMDVRRDALPAAAEIILGLETICRSGDGVGTAGRGFIHPNATNVVPAEVELWLEIRSQDEGFLADRTARLQYLAQQVASRRDLEIELARVSAEQPVRVDPGIMARIDAVTRELGLSAHQLPSGAGHDTNQLAHVGPVAMIFVPSRGGRSHCPEEWTAPDDVLAGVRVLGETLLRLDQGAEPALPPASDASA